MVACAVAACRNYSRGILHTILLESVHCSKAQHFLHQSCAAAVAACRQYDQRGIQMDRLLLWEAAPINPPSTIFSELPKELFHKYQYFNIPAITDYTDASHPVSAGAI
jgi:hypothetical protein